MKRVECPAKRVDQRQLREELLAAGVQLGPEEVPLDDVYLSGSSVYVRVLDVADESAVRDVVEAHVPPPEKTLQQTKQANAEKGFSADGPLAILVRALVLVVADLQNENAARVAARQPLRTLTPKQIHAAIRDKFGSLTE